jgi:hypothetical protein
VRKRLEAREGAFSLGRWELPVAVLALAWLLIALMVLVAPRDSRTPVYIVLGLIAVGAVFFGLMLAFDREALEVEPVEVEPARSPAPTPEPAG